MPSLSPLVLIPSQLCTHLAWQPQLDTFSNEFQISVADHRDHPTISAIAKSILDKRPGSFALAAHGMGGFIAMEIMRQAPQRVTKLALFDTLASADTPAQTERRNGYAQLVRDGLFDQVIEERIPILFSESSRRNRHLLEVARDMARATGAEGFLNQQAAIMGRIDSSQSLTDIKCPTLLAIGREDAITSLADAEMIAAHIPQARLEIVENSGHLIMLEQPERVSEIMKDWLSG